MKKLNFFFALAATCVLGMNAQSTETPLIQGVNFSVEGQQPALNPFWEEGDDEEDKYLPGTYSIAIDSQINMVFEKYNESEMTETLGFQPYVMLQTGSGFAIDATFYALDSFKVDDSSSLYAFPMKFEEGGKDKYRWGNPYMGAFYATPMVCFLKREGGELPNVITQQQLAEDEELATSVKFYSVDDDPVFFQQSSYTSTNTLPAELLAVYPDNTWTDETFADAYNNGDARFSFSNVVNFEDITYAGEIIYYFKDGSDNVEVELSFDAGNILSEWSPLDGYYQVVVSYNLPNVSADKIAAIEISLFDMTSMEQEIEDVTLTLDNNETRSKKITTKGNTSMVQELVAQSEAVDIYNLQGLKVGTAMGSDLPILPRGIYLINGKKIAIK